MSQLDTAEAFLDSVCAVTGSKSPKAATAPRTPRSIIISQPMPCLACGFLAVSVVCKRASARYTGGSGLHASGRRLPVKTADMALCRALLAPKLGSAGRYTSKPAPAWAAHSCAHKRIRRRKKPGNFHWWTDQPVPPFDSRFARSTFIALRRLEIHPTLMACFAPPSALARAFCARRLRSSSGMLRSVSRVIDSSSC